VDGVNASLAQRQLGKKPGAVEESNGHEHSRCDAASHWDLLGVMRADEHRRCRGERGERSLHGVAQVLADAATAVAGSPEVVRDHRDPCRGREYPESLGDERHRERGGGGHSPGAGQAGEPEGYAKAAERGPAGVAGCLPRGGCHTHVSSRADQERGRLAHHIVMHPTQAHGTRGTPGPWSQDGADDKPDVKLVPTLWAPHSFTTTAHHADSIPPTSAPARCWKAPGPKPGRALPSLRFLSAVRRKDGFSCSRSCSHSFRIRSRTRTDAWRCHTTCTTVRPE